MFVYANELLFIGRIGSILWALVTAVLGVTCLAAAVQRCLLLKTAWYETLLLYAIAFLLIKPGLYTDLAGFALLATVIMLQWKGKRRLLTHSIGNQAQTSSS
jgi:TRAP-type uncharacterized transport system fused permease subunit